MLPILYFLVLQIAASISESCENTNKFYISINKEPEYYVPKATYIGTIC